MSCAKTDEPIEMPFEEWTWVDPRTMRLTGAQTPQRKGHFVGGGGRPPAMQPFVIIL